jgi:D-proline reductase (dithiol) PrdB
MRVEDVPASLSKPRVPDFGDPPWASAPPPDERQVAIVSTAGLIHRGDRPFRLGSADYRIIDRDDPRDLLITHISTNFDRSGFAQDHEVSFPLKRLQEAATTGAIAAAARFHFSFMGATNPELMRPAAEQVARAMRDEGTNVALLVPV